MYELIKGLHNLTRWVVVFGGIYALITSLRGVFAGGVWGTNDKRAGVIFTSALGLQLILGLLLYFISPYIKGLIGAGMDTVMVNTEARFFVVEHFVIMLIAVVIAQLGYSLGKRAPTDRAKFVRSSIGYVIAALLIAYGIPWWRPLLPGL